ncbi:S-layer homology domain-containing protein [Ruminiclostridium cellulolyticum]|uniref:Sugar-binding domain protein n=1 Tax=Ruminiclostridium cellulolyticum (strain ATCC 35319 / DSM 5812 / JCM 6584 / H10) TaxID=394503 RepID=B8I0Y0_RUMCH|nr:S-layer homology domain-containing protein [Ruminiclostridium cellulolyticum]ACL77536.1 sugar-binding domain protein [Ruminiclostridium cellulolyticum H10]
MSKKVIMKMVAVVVSVCMLLSTVFQSGIAYAAEDASNLVISESQVSGEYKFNLTQVGDIDWLHLKGDGSNGIVQIKKDTTNPSAISFNILPNSVPEGKVSNGDPDRIANTWSDGMAGYESGTDDTGFAVLLPPADNRGAGTCTENVGWNFSVQAQPVQTTVIFTLGLWQANVGVNFYMDDVQVDTKNISAGGGALTFKYQVTVPANKVLKVEGIQTDILWQDGNSSISSIAVSSAVLVDKEAIQTLYNNVKDIVQGSYTEETWTVFESARTTAQAVLDDPSATQDMVDNAKTALEQAQAALVTNNANELKITQSQVSGEYKFNLTQVGDIDWLHLKGDGSNGIVQIKKDTTNPSAISFNILPNSVPEGKVSNGDPDRIAKTWSDGMAGYESGTDDTGFAVLSPPVDNRGAGTCTENVGWNFTVSAQPVQTTVIFTLGLWQANVGVNFYMDDVQVDTKNISAGGGALTFKYQVTVPANKVLKVEGIQTDILWQDGNSSISSIAVSSVVPVDKEALQTLYNNVKDIVQGSYTEETWTVFESARTTAQAVLDDPSATQTLVDNAKTSLEQAQAALVTNNANELNVTQSQINGVYNVDLTAVGDVDWLHLRGDGSNNIIQIKKNTQNAITFSALQNTVPEGKETNGDTNRTAASWTDGMSGYEALANDTGFGVFLPLSDDRGAGACKANVGWNFTIAAQPTSTTVVFSTGLWQAKVNVNFYLDDLYVSTKSMEAGGTAQAFKYQVVVPANKVLKVVGLQTYKNAYDGNSSLSTIAVSSQEIADKSSLQAFYDEFSGITQSFFTDASWTNFIDARTAAKAVLEKAVVTQAEVDNAKAALILAQNNLVKKDTNVMIDYTGGKRGSSYGLGNLVDEQDRYQTFTSSEDFIMEYVQVGLYKNSDDGSDLVVKLYATDNNGLPTGSPLAQTTVNKKDVINGGLTTAKLVYDVKANTRYAIDVTQTTLKNGMYNWIVMQKNHYSKNEFFGKITSGKFVPEAWLGTGLLRVVKKINVDRSALEALVSEVSNLNEKIYTVESWLHLANAAEEARNCLNNFDALQAEIDAETGKLQAAKDSLVININISDFSSFISSFDNMVVKGYTDASVAILTDAITNAKQLDISASDDEKLQAYVSVLNAIAKLQVSGKYSSETDGGLTGSFGFEGDMNAPIAFIDGSFRLPSRGNLMIRFGVTGLKAKGVSIDWYNRDGYLPCYVSEYTVDDVTYKIEEFANKHTIDGNPVEVAYVKMTAINNSSEKRLLPVVSKELVPLNNAAESSYVINAGETVVREYAIKADRFENEGHTGERHEVEPKAPFPADQKILEAAKAVADIGENSIFENNYASMKTYWDDRLAGIIDIKMPNSKDANNKDSLVNAYKAGYIYTLIIKDQTFLHVGENGYDRLFSHDTIGILQSLITAGDFVEAKDYLESVPMTGGINIENGEVDPDLYWDANWKLPWAYSVYLSKTGDIDFIKEKYEGVLKKMAHSIHDDRTGPNHDGIMKSTLAIDTYGQWTVDDQAALMGLIAYKYICNELAIKENDQSKKEYYLAEAQWANAEYDSLLKVVTETLENTINRNNLNYIPASIVEPNTANRCNDIRDGNWASMLLFGSFPWDGYLYGADQSKAGANIDMIDQTYAYGIERRKDLPGASPYNFGGYPHGWYSSAYNAGYGISALRGEAYRDIGIKAYEFAVNSAMSSPFGWWEGVGPGGNDYPSQDPTSPLWNRDNASGGGGSCQHMWGQATASKVLYDAFIAERIYNDNKNAEIIIGRGIPKEWVTNATNENNVVAAVENYPILQGGRAGYTIVRNGSNLKITFDCNKTNSKVDAGTVEQWSIQLPAMVNNISSASVGTVDNANGIVNVPIDTKEVTIVLKDLLGSSMSIDTVSLPNGKVGEAYSNVLTATGGTVPYKWSAEGLPAGLTITNEGEIKGIPTASGTFTVNIKVEDSSNPILSISKTLSIIVAPANQPGGSTGDTNGSTGESVIPVDSIRNGDRTILSVSLKASNESGTASANIGKAIVNELVQKAKEAEKNGQKATVEIKLDSVKDTKSVKIGVPAESIKEIAETAGAEIKINTRIGSVIFDAKAIDTINASASSGNVNIIISNVQASSLSEEIRDKVSERTVYDFSIQADNKEISDFGGGTVRVSVPYAPKVNEKHSSIIIYGIDNAGELRTVRSIYNPATGTVDFKATQPLQYVVGYNEVNFTDVKADAWYEKAVGFLAAREMVSGTGDGRFAPQNKVTRADFLIMVMNSYGIRADKAVTENFSDAGSKYYTGYLGTAKRLGLVSGTGDNKYMPEAAISRQDMLVILYRALDILGELPDAKTGNFDSFIDTKDISGYAENAMKLFVKAGIVIGNDKQLNPKSDTSRAEAVQVMYNLLSGQGI